MDGQNYNYDISNLTKTDIVYDLFERERENHVSYVYQLYTDVLDTDGLTSLDNTNDLSSQQENFPDARKVDKRGIWNLV